MRVDEIVKNFLLIVKKDLEAGIGFEQKTRYKPKPLSQGVVSTSYGQMRRKISRETAPKEDIAILLLGKGFKFYESLLNVKFWFDNDLDKVMKTLINSKGKINTRIWHQYLKQMMQKSIVETKKKVSRKTALIKGREQGALDTDQFYNSVVVFKK